MKKMWVVYAAAAAVLYLVGNTLYVAGSFKSIDPVSAGDIQATYRGIYGPEDMDLDERAGRLYISSSDRWSIFKGLPTTDAIWVLDVDSTATPRRMTHNYPGEFHPHGISLLQKETESFLFVVNHNAAGNFVESFRIHRDSLVYQHSYSDDNMCCPNDVVAVDRDKFYVTNDHGTKGGFKRTLEDYGRIPYSSVLYFDGQKFTTVIDGLRYGNGINVDGTRLYVATTTGQNLLTYERDLTTGQLTQVGKIGLKTGLDNIDVDADGNLWIAAHPKLLAFVAHAKDSTKKSPSQVLRLVPQPGNTFRVDEIFMDDGSILSGSSIAVRYKDELFVGGVFQPRILRIKLKTSP